MKNIEKDDLHRLVKLEINRGHDIKKAIKTIEKLGFKPATIGKYYKLPRYSNNR